MASGCREGKKMGLRAVWTIWQHLREIIVMDWICGQALGFWMKQCMLGAFTEIGDSSKWFAALVCKRCIKYGYVEFQGERI